jgi:hypothetical protein
MAYRDDLQAALDRAEQAEHQLHSLCLLHGDRPAAGVCGACGRGVCEDCLMSAPGATYCPMCFGKRRRRVGWWIVPLAVVLAGAGAVTVYRLMNREPEPEPVLQLSPQGAIAHMKQQRLKDPCDKDLALDLAEHELKAEPAEVIALTADYEKTCGPFVNLRWRKVKALEAMGAWGDALEEDNRLIAQDPTDFNVWSWRGHARAEREEWEPAAADRRQAMVLWRGLVDEHGYPRASGAQRESVVKFAETEMRLGRRCEAAFALRGMYDGLPAPEACAAQEGRGLVELHDVLGVPYVPARVTVDNATGIFVVDARAAFVVLGRRFAERAGVTARRGPAQILRLGKLAQADLSVAQHVAMGDASADMVEVAVVDDLPAGVDGVLGDSFLIRFESAP